MIHFFLVCLFVACLTEPNPPTWPKNVYVFDPANSGSTQTAVDDAFRQNGGHNPAFNGQWSNNRYAFLFKPGNHNVQVNVGFYTSVIGLGVAPSDTTINKVTVENGDFDYRGGALDNFWRSAENFATGTTLWAVSQACPARRLLVRGDLTLWQYNSGCCAGEASGGYLADTVVTGTISSGSQQQWFTRNTNFGNWVGGVWNIVFVGNSGKQLNDHCGNTNGNPWTIVRETPSIAEKPYITIDNGGKYSLRVPRPETNKVGPTTNYAAATVVDFSQVYVATESDSAATINAKISQGLHIILTPGNYQFSEAVTIKNANTVILGIGFPTITATNGNAIFHVTDVDGVRLAGVLLQAGRTRSPTLVLWGDSKTGNAANPGVMYDVFVRVGGTNDPKQYQVSTNAMVTINHNFVVFDNSWLWRADHDITGNVVNSENPSLNGLVVNGDSVVTYALAVEHQLQDAVVWNGEGGKSYFFQCEYPYDVTQQNFGAPGYAGFKVTARNHNGWGHGVYSFFRDATVTAQTGIKTTGSGAQFVHPFTRYLAGNGGIAHVVNNQGAPVNQSNPLAYIC